MNKTSCKWYPLCPMRRFYKKGVLDHYWIETYCQGSNWHQCIRYQMEAEGRYHPDWMLPDGTLDPALKQDDTLKND